MSCFSAIVCTCSISVVVLVMKLFASSLLHELAHEHMNTGYVESESELRDLPLVLTPPAPTANPNIGHKYG